MKNKKLFNLCPKCWGKYDLVDNIWDVICGFCLSNKYKVQTYIKDIMNEEEKINFAINILYDVKYEHKETKIINKAINILKKYYD